jgi:hypothetical protein
MPCIVKKTFEEAAAAGALLIAQVKDNQPTLHQCAERVCQTSTPVDQTTTKDAKRRSRDETRIVKVFDPNVALADTEWADHVGAIIRVSRTTHARQSATGLWKTSSEVAYFACEFLPPAALCAQATSAMAASARTPVVFAAIRLSSLACDPLRATFSVSTASRTYATLAIASPSVASTLWARYASCRER